MALGAVAATELTAGPVTVIERVPVMPLAPALIVALPAATPVTRPPDETVAVPVADDVQVAVLVKS